MEVKTLIENLTDSGCSAEGTRRAKALYEAGDMDGLVKYLRKCQCDLVEEMHDSQPYTQICMMAETRIIFRSIR